MLSTPQIKNAQTRQLADDIIGAAQALEVSARYLKSQAKAIRQFGLTQWDASTDVVAAMREHKGHDVKAGARQALIALGAAKNIYLTERTL